MDRNVHYLTEFSRWYLPFPKIWQFPKMPHITDWSWVTIPSWRWSKTTLLFICRVWRNSSWTAAASENSNQEPSRDFIIYTFYIWRTTGQLLKIGRYKNKSGKHALVYLFLLIYITLSTFTSVHMYELVTITLAFYYWHQMYCPLSEAKMS